MSIKTLGTILHATGTARKVLRVDVLDGNVPVWNLQKIVSIYNCKQVVGGKE